MTIDLNKLKERLMAKRTELENDIAALTQALTYAVGPIDVY